MARRPITLAFRLSALSQPLGAGLRTAIEASRRRIGGRATLLPRLADICPGAWTASGRYRGRTTIPVRCIVGTASYPHGSRCTDFLPVRGHEPADWPARWSRLVSSVHEQAALPPVDLVRAADDYWITDGHNRVALAIETGQLLIDAEVTELGHLGDAGRQAGAVTDGSPGGATTNDRSARLGCG